jgi:ubiquinone/menaquinone biosynthesis C-methylase UbiE
MPENDAGRLFAGPEKRPPASFRDHYSYDAYADPAMAETFDQRRFGGPIGALVHDREARTLLALLGPITGRRLLDVGTGTGRAALTLARHGAQVTGVDASAQMLAKARERAKAEALDVRFEDGDAHALPFADGAFDAAISLRVIMHTPDWRQCVGELCRVSREMVVFDFPALMSAAAIQAGARRVLRILGGRVEAYRVFTDRAIASELARHGFRADRVERLFALPIALHKTINARAVTERVESALATVGVRGLIGSPVMIAARRVR